MLLFTLTWIGTALAALAAIAGLAVLALVGAAFLVGAYVAVVIGMITATAVLGILLMKLNGRIASRT